MPYTPSTLPPAQVAEAIIAQGVAKHRTRIDRIFFKAVLAGIMLSFGGLMSQIVSDGSPQMTQNNPGLVMILSGFVFPVGLIMIVLQGFELLTANMMVMPMAAGRRAIPWWGVPLNWLVVTFGNLVGSLFFASVLVNHTGVISTNAYMTSVKSFAIHRAVDPSWLQIFLKGIAANILVNVAVWQAAGAKDTISKIYSLWIPIWIFVACGYDHVVANMYSIPLGIMFGADLSVAHYIRKSFIASWIGNMVGALIIALSALYFYFNEENDQHMQDAEEGKRHRDETAAHL